MNTLRISLLASVAALLLATNASAGNPYNASAGSSEPTATVEETYTDGGGRRKVRHVERQVDADRYGNASGTQYDLAVDGAFEGQTIAVLQFYTGGGFDFELPRAALGEKGFAVYRWTNAAPTPEDLAEALQKSTQLWIISGDRQHLNEQHLAVITAFYEAGHGLYLWGDNPPYVGDANFVSAALFDTTMDTQSYVQGEQVLDLQKRRGGVGVLPNHLLTTGIAHLYEGHTIPAIQNSGALEPLIYGSNEILVAGFYDKMGRRAILDSGFTRLYINWDTAGTGRYVGNAAAWLTNVERFGDGVVGTDFPTDHSPN